MRRPSLRWRLALLSATLAGGVLVGFALLSGWLIYQAKLERLDAQLSNRLLPLSRPANEEDPISPETRLAQELGLASQTAVAIALIDREGQVRYRSPWWPETLSTQGRWSEWPGATEPFSPERDPWLRRPSLNEPTIGPTTWRTSEGRWRIIGRVTPLGRIMIAVSLQSLHQEMAILWRIYGLTIPGALAAIAGGAWWFSGRALRSVDTLSQTITQVTAQGLHQRVPTTGMDQEFETLVTVFNAMLERLERSFHQASRFSGDAAHELKTPLAILRGELEQAVQHAEAGSPMQQTLSHLLEEVSRLSSIVRKLLLLSLADAGQMSLRREPVDITALVQEQLEDVALLAPELTVTAALEPNLEVMGDRDLLIQVVQNLLSNAIKYNLSRGWIRVQGKQQQGQVGITVANAAKPLSLEEQAQLFERFYRGNPARTRVTDGLGLGLSLAREIARAHGGDVILVTSLPSEVQFCLTLPTGGKLAPT